MKPEMDFTWGVPAVRCGGWLAWTAPLLAWVLSKDRTIDEVVVWGKDNRHNGSTIRHMVAWLSFTDKIHYDPLSKSWRQGPEPKECLTPCS
jgi:hypothetical protein